MKVMVVDKPTGDWYKDYPKARVIEVTAETKLESLTITSISIFAANKGDTMDMLAQASARIKEVYGDSCSSDPTILATEAGRGRTS